MTAGISALHAIRVFGGLSFTRIVLPFVLVGFATLSSTIFGSVAALGLALILNFADSEGEEFSIPRFGIIFAGIVHALAWIIVPFLTFRKRQTSNKLAFSQGDPGDTRQAFYGHGAHDAHDIGEDEDHPLGQRWDQRAFVADVTLA